MIIPFLRQFLPGPDFFPQFCCDSGDFRHSSDVYNIGSQKDMDATGALFLIAQILYQKPPFGVIGMEGRRSVLVVKPQCARFRGRGDSRGGIGITAHGDILPRHARHRAVEDRIDARDDPRGDGNQRTIKALFGPIDDFGGLT